MILKKLISVKNEFNRFTQSEKLFILLAMVCGFLINAGYSIVRPVSESFFMTAYGSGAFPYAWIIGIPFNLLIVALYNRYLPQWGCRKTFFISTSIVISTILMAVFLFRTGGLFSFLFYLWKEVFILIMFQQLWSIIHSTIKFEKAKYLYGIFFAFGGLGSIFASALPGFLAVKLGSENLLYSSIPIYILLTIFYCALLKHSNPSIHVEKETPLKDGVSLVLKSKPLMFILLILVFMQLASTFVNFQFNTVLEKTVQGEDLRTEYYGRIHGLGSFVTVSLQLAGSFFLVHFLGLRRGHLFVPLFLILNAIGSLFMPTFRMIAASYITIKAFDFSIFGVLKEMLYIPLSHEEKFQAKTFIDVFVYRASKALGALLILLFQFFGASMSALSWSLMGILAIWSIVVFKMFITQPLLAEEK